MRINKFLASAGLGSRRKVEEYIKDKKVAVNGIIIEELGYDVKDGRITVNPDGAETVKLIFRKYAVEQVGTSEIAKFLTKAGCRTYRGSTKWKSNTVIKILNREI